MARFAGNRTVIVGELAEFGETRWTTDDADNPHRMPYRPVTVSVLQGIRGGPSAGDHVVIRRGELDGSQFLVEGSGFEAGYAVGDRVVLFLTDAVDAGDGVAAHAVNAAFRIADGGRAVSDDGRFSLDVNDLTELVRDGG